MSRFVLAALVAGTIVSVLAARPPERRRRHSEIQPVLLRPAVLETVGKPFKPLLIDIYWLRTLNAIGGDESPEKNRSLYGFGRTLVDVDPRFYTAYTYIGLNIPFQTGRDTWVNGEYAEDLYRRGLKQFPKDMKLHLYLGFCLFGQQKKFKEASEIFLAGAKTEKAPAWMGPLGARLLAHSGNAQEALALTLEMAAGAEDEESKALFEERIKQLQIEVLLQQVDEAVKAYTQRSGPPATLADVIASGDYKGPTVDPFGGVISLTPSGRATSTSVERRYEVYE